MSKRRYLAGYVDDTIIPQDVHGPGESCIRTALKEGKR